MDGFVVKKAPLIIDKMPCECNKIHGFLHELSQSLLVIHAYVNGCNERVKDNTLSKEQIVDVLSKINKHAEIISNNVHCMNQYLKII